MHLCDRLPWLPLELAAQVVHEAVSCFLLDSMNVAIPEKGRQVVQQDMQQDEVGDKLLLVHQPNPSN